MGNRKREGKGDRRREKGKEIAEEQRGEGRKGRDTAHLPPALQFAALISFPIICS